MKLLDIGPGNTRLDGFETVDVVPGPNVDHVADAGKLPFKDNSIDGIHNSHLIEHVPWYLTDDTFKEWVRVLKPGAWLEVWTVNAYKIMKAVVELEETGVWTGPGLGWRTELTNGDPYKWSAGRLFNRKTGKTDAYLHKAMFTPKYLTQCFETAGLVEIRMMDPETEIRGKRHPWINMGVRGVKLGNI